MKKQTDRTETRDRLNSLIPGAGRGGYSLSSAAADPLKRKLRGRWAVVEHVLAGDSWLSKFLSRSLRGVELTGAEYRAEYEFRDGICLKRVEIQGTLPAGDQSAEYRYRLRVASSWDLDGPEFLAIRPELGYQCTELGGEPAAVKDLDDPPDPVSVSFRFDGEALLLEEGDDFKRLVRIR